MSSDAERTRPAVEAARADIARIIEWAQPASLERLRADTMLRYAIERAFITLAAAIQDIPPTIVARAELPVRLVAGFRNVLAHTYDDTLDGRIVSTILDDLPALDAKLAAILADLGPA